MVKLISMICGLVGVFWLALFGGMLVYWYDRRPLNFPAPFQLKIPFHVLWLKTDIPLPAFSLPSSLKAQRDQAITTYNVAEAKSLQKIQSDKVAFSALNAKYEKSQTSAQTQIKTRTVTLVREIHDTLTPTIDREFPLPVGLLRTHNAAAAGCSDISCIPLAPGQSNDSPSAVSASTLGEVVTKNYGVCLANAETLNELQSWVRDTVKQSSK